jgi:hypothetical protein
MYAEPEKAEKTHVSCNLLEIIHYRMVGLVFPVETIPEAIFISSTVRKKN